MGQHSVAELEAHGRAKTVFGEQRESSRGENKKGQRSRWPSGLRQPDLKRTSRRRSPAHQSGSILRFRRPIVWPAQARASRGERSRRRPGASPRPKGQAVNALRLAQGWQAEIEAGGITRADIARREGLSRARVTQVMALLGLPADVQARLLDGQEQWSIREALREVGRYYS